MKSKFFIVFGLISLVGCGGPEKMKDINKMIPSTVGSMSKGIFGASAKVNTNQEINLSLEGAIDPVTKKYVVTKMNVQNVSTTVLAALLPHRQLEIEHAKTYNATVIELAKVKGMTAERIAKILLSPAMGAAFSLKTPIGDASFTTGKGEVEENEETTTQPSDTMQPE